MPLFFMDSEKSSFNLFWSNRYCLEAADLAGAMLWAADIRVIERNCTSNFASLTKYRVSTALEHDDVYQIIEDNLTGLRALDGGQLMPLFCRVNCIFNTVGGGRPSRKYWCAPLMETDQSFGDLTPATITFFQEQYVNALLGVAGFVDIDEQPFISGSVKPRVGMRQLRRGSKKKHDPIIP